MNKILTILFLLCFACCGFAQTLWTGDVSADWHDAGNWTQGVPTTGQTATIPGAAQGGVFPTVSQVLVIDFTIQSFGGSIIFMADAFNNGSVVNSSGGTMTLSNGATFTNSGTVTFLNDGVFDNDGTFINYGTFNQNGNGIFNNNPQGNFINFGTIGNIGNYNNDGTLENRGQLTNSSQFTNNGITRNYGFFSNTFVSTFTNATGGQFFNETGAQLFIDNTFNNNGQITDNGSTSVNGQGMINNNGTMNLNGLYSVGTMFNNDGTVNNSGNFRINFGTVNNNSTWNNTGSLNNTGRLNNNAGANLNNTASLSVASCSKLFQYSSNVIDAVTNDGVVYEVSGTVNTNASSQGQELTDENANPLPFVQCKDINIQLDATGNVDITPGDLIVDADAKYCNIVTVAADQTSFSCADLGPNTVEFSITDGFGGTSTCNSIVTIIEKSPNPCNTSFLNYCTASATTANSEFIQSVAMTTLNNISGDDGGYADYTNLVAELDFGNFYDLTLTPGFPGSPNNVAWRVWIDWNIDGDFDDDGELVVSEDAAMQVVGSINVPGTAVPGTTRMRVTTKRFPAVNACGTYPNGEVEDYTVKVNSDIIIQQCPDNQVVSAQPGQTTAPAGWIPAKGFSTCPNSIEIELIEGLPNGSQFPLGVTTNTLQFTDGCDGVKDCSFTITVNSTPVNFSLDCPSDIVLMGNADLDGAIANWIPPFPTATCPQGLSLPTQISGPAFGDFLPMGSSTQICYETSDNCGNVDNCCFFIFVQDPNNSLTFNNCPTADIVIDAQPGATGATATYANLTTTSDCPTGGVTLDILDGLPSGSIFPIGTTQVVYRAFDDCNSADLCEFNVTVNATPSTISSNCPDNIVLSAAPGAFSQEVSWAAVTASSDCASGSISVAQTEGLPNGSAFPVGNTVIIYTISDGCGNAEICNFNVTINVSAATLDLTCPADITVDAAPGEVGTVVTWADPAISTDCFNGGAEATLVSPLASGSTFPLGSKEVIYFGSDDCGNTASCSFFINVNPVSADLNITCPNNIVQTVNVNQNSATATWSAPTTSTTCSGNVSTTQIAGAASGSAFDAGVTTITYSASDDCGNVEICSFTVTVDVNIPADDPEIDLTCLNDITVTAATGATSASVGFDVPTATTTCNAGGGGNGGTNPPAPTAPCATRTISNTVSCSGGSNYAMWLDFDGLENRYSMTNGQFIEYDNGTATLSGTITNVANGNIQFQVNASFAGRTTTSPTGAPKAHACLSPDQSNFYFYENNSGILTGLGSAAGAVLRIENTMEAFQLGNGANVTNSTLDFGASGWLKMDILHQPSGSLTLTKDTATPGNDADYNLMLSGSDQICNDNGFVDCSQAPTPGNNSVNCYDLVSNNIPGFVYMGQYGSSKYYCSEINATWANASATAFQNGGHLAVINSSGENNFIKNNIIADVAWIGYTDEDVEGTFEWVWGNPSYTNWLSGEPNDQDPIYTNGADYTAIIKSDGLWRDRDGGNTYEYVMEIPASCAAPNFTLLGENGGSQYYISTASETWEQANAIAQANGFNLVTINDAAENAYLTSLVTGVWLGFSDRISEGSFEWIDGSPVTYTNWSQWQPDNWQGYGGEDYVSLQTDGTWNDGSGLGQRRYVIEVKCPVVTPTGCAAPDNVVGFTLLGEFNDSKYYIYNSATTWTSAKSIAAQNGGHLTTISSQAENDFIWNNMNPASGSVWTGYTAIGTTNFSWDNGEPNGFENWQVGEPNETASDVATRLKNDNGKWTDRVLTNHFEFIMEIPCGGNTGGSSDATVTQIAGNAPNTQFPVGTTTVIYEATDDCGNVDYCSFDVIVLAPATNLSLNNCPADITVQTAAGDDTAIVSWTAPTATSDCATGDVVVSQIAGFASGSAFPTGVTTVTYRAVDGCGNEQLCSFFVTVEGTPAPPTEITVNCVENFTIQTLPGDNSAVATWTEPTGTTTCAGSNVEVIQIGGLPNGGNFPIGTTVIFYRLEDDCGNVQSCAFNVTVQAVGSSIDITCPPNVNVNADPDADYGLATFAAATATSTCYTGTPSIAQIAGLPSGSLFPVGNSLVFFRATDDCGNVDVCNFVVTVNATPITNIDPCINDGGDSDGDGVCDDNDVCIGFDDNIDADGDGIPDGCDACPNDATGDSDGDGVCDSDDICAGFDDNLDTDNDGTPDGCDACPNDAAGDSDGDGVCDSDDICAGFDDNIDADGDGIPDGCDACPNDAAGDSDGDGVCDSEDICAGFDDNIDTDGDGTPDGCDVCPADANNDSDGDGVCDSNDICPGFDDNLDADGDGIPDGCDNLNCACDANGDTSSPTIQGVPANMIVECDNIPTAATVTALDECTANIAVTFAENILLGICDNSYTIERTWTATDDCGNTSVSTQTLTVQDTQSPVLSGVPMDVTVDAMSIPNANAVSATDNCDANVTITSDDVITYPNDNCNDYYTIVRTWTATDACGNAVQATQNITVLDDSNILDDDNDGVCNANDICPGFDDNEDLNNNGIPDGCEGAITLTSCPDFISYGIPFNNPQDGDDVTWTEPTATTSCPDGGLTITQTAGQNNGTFFQAGTVYTITYLIEDACGNTATCSFEISLGSEVGYTFCPADINVTTDSMTAIASWTEPNPESSCGNTSGSYNQSGAALNGTAFPIGTTEVIYLYTDGCGNQAQCSFNVTVTSTACDDDDNDGVCNADDQCEGFDDSIDLDNDGIIDGCDPCITGATCDDGDANTENDVFDANCGCAGTPINNEPDCDNITITAGVNSIIVTNLGGAPISSLQIFNAQWGGEFSCFADCNDTETVSVTAGTYYVYAKYYEANYQLICQNVQTITVTDAPCDDDDNDGVCNAADQCEGFDDNIDMDNDGIIDGCDPCQTGATCDDGNPNTINDAFDADCNCIGENPNGPCFGTTAGNACDDGDPCTFNDTIDNDCNCVGTQDADLDGDGVCDAIDQCPNSDDNIDVDNDGIPDGCDPCITGATCDDGDANTDNDVFDENCNCAGTTGPVEPDCDNISITAGANSIIVTNLGGAPISSLQIFNSTWGGEFSCFADCNDTETVAVTPGTYYVYAKYYEANYQLICQNVQTITVTDAPCDDDDNDGVCNDVDQCAGFDDAIDMDNDGIPDGCDPCQTGATCDDGNAATINDAYDADCNCVGEIDECNGTPDSDGDGVCDALDVCPGFDDFEDVDNDSIADGCDPCITGATCDDGDANTENDVYDANCGCAGTPIGCDDDDNDGVCNADDQCEGFDDSIDVDNDGIIDGCDPCITGATCDDGDANTENDVYDANCGCAGTPISGDPDCADISITVDNGNIVVTNLDGAPISSLQIFNSLYQGEFSCFADCNATESIPVAAGTYYVYAKYYTAAYQLICENVQTVTVTTGGGGCTDADGDGYCVADDCDDNDATLPATPGTSCNDGNPNTTGDQIQADGCTCEGTPVNPGDPNCADISITTDAGHIIVSGLDGAPVTSLQIFNATYQTEFSCFADCNATESIPLGAGTYYVYAKYYNAQYQLICEVVETINKGVNSVAIPNDTGILEAEQMKATINRSNLRKNATPDINIFPNPATETVKLSVKDFAGEAGTVMVYDLFGKAVYQQDFLSLPAEPMDLNLTDYRSGVYQVTVAVEGYRLMTNKLVVQD